MKRIGIRGAACLLAGVLCALGMPAQAQDRTCGTSYMVEQSLRAHPELRANQDILTRATRAEEQRRAAARQSASPGGPVRIIPIVFHVIHNYGPENVSDAQIRDAVRVLNEDFANRARDTNRITAAFKPIVGTTNFEFRLANIDPNGNCTNGITRTPSTLTYSADENVKDLISWDTRKYMNVWVVNTISFGAGGYAYYPGTAPSQDHEGIVVLHGQCGSIGTASGSNFAARTLTHEMGHFFNLAHTWGSTNEPGLASNCNVDDDVADTPNTIGVSDQGCNLNFRSCGLLSNVENYMDYGACSRMFTIGQSVRMRVAAESSVGARSSLWTDDNLTATGVMNATPTLCAPQVAFSVTQNLLCAGNSIRLMPSINGVVLDTSLTVVWRTPGAAAPSYTAFSPTVTYPNPGRYDIELLAYNRAGRDSVRIPNSVLVLDGNASYRVGDAEDFEGAAFPQVGASPYNQWVLGSGWALNTRAAQSGTHSLRVQASAQSGPAWFLTPRFDLSNVSPNAYLQYKFASARTNGSNDDVLRIYTTTTCNRNVVLRMLRRGSTGPYSAYTNPGFFTGSFLPQAADWRTEQMRLSQLAGQPDVRFKFELTPSGGNFFYIDSMVVVDPPLPTTLESVRATRMAVAPNPGRDRLEVNLPTATAFTYTLQDPLGRTLAEGRGQAKAFTLSVHSLPEGAYMLTVVQGERLYRERVVVR